MKQFGITRPEFEEYMMGLLPPREGVLADMEAHAAREGLPIIGPMVGNFLRRHRSGQEVHQHGEACYRPRGERLVNHGSSRVGHRHALTARP